MFVYVLAHAVPSVHGRVGVDITMTSHCGVKQVGLLMLIYPDLTRSALEKRHPSFPWNDDGSWSCNGRDEDYGEAKKRKFNGGVRRLLLRLFR